MLLFYSKKHKKRNKEIVTEVIINIYIQILNQ